MSSMLKIPVGVHYKEFTATEKLDFSDIYLALKVVRQVNK